MDAQTQRAIDLVWEQGINVIRHDVQELAKSIDRAKQSMISARRWVVGLILTIIPAYAAVFVALWYRR